MRRRLAVTTLLLLIAVTAAAQRPRGNRNGFSATRQLRYATVGDFDGSFQFCRVVFDQSPYGDGGNWSVDFPRADENLSIRMSELTKTWVGRDPDDTPKHLLVNLQDPVITHCPFIMMTEVGSTFFSPDEAAGLQSYLLKGGFLWADDFWGERAWANWEGELRKALPASRFPIIDLPIDHPIFHSLMTLTKVPQIPSINFWGGPGGPTSERGAESAIPHARAILDDHGRVMVLMTHNTDIGDSFEREGDSRAYFLEFSVYGYALGVNVLLYAMSH